MNSSQVTLREAADAQRPVVERLVQLERHDVSAFRGYTPDADGRFAADWLPAYFSEPDRHAYLIYAGPTLAGFALVRSLEESEGGHSVFAFFIVRALRRRSVGHRAALELLRRHPGHWRIAFQEENPGVGTFWRRVASAAVGPRWREVPPGDGPPDTWLLLEVSAGCCTGAG